MIQDEHILYYIYDKWQDRESVRFYHEMDSQVSLLKLIPSMDSSLLDYMAEHYDAVVIDPSASAVFRPMNPAISIAPSKNGSLWEKSLS